MNSKIGVRDDDVLVGSSSTDNPLKRFQMVHEWICEVPDTLIHTPTILVTEIQEFPDCIEYVREETAEGRMMPEIHGLKHINYATLTFDEVVNHLDHCKEWIKREFNYDATRWYTPWGAGEDEAGAHLRPAAAAIGLKLVTCKNIVKLKGRYGVVQELRDGRNISYLNGNEIFIHWWENASRLKRVIEVIKHGSWNEAAAANKELFAE